MQKGRRHPWKAREKLLLKRLLNALKTSISGDSPEGSWRSRCLEREECRPNPIETRCGGGSERPRRRPRGSTSAAGPKDVDDRAKNRKLGEGEAEPIIKCVTIVLLFTMYSTAGMFVPLELSIRQSTPKTIDFLLPRSGSEAVVRCDKRNSGFGPCLSGPFARC